ncbi:hypothetical protein N2152v2_004020 [Parachlorella kessleri]
MDSGTEEVLTGQEVCPKYSVEHVKCPDGSKVTVQIAVALPGVADSTNIQFVVQERLCTVSVPGRYHVAIPLAESVEPTAELVRFVRKKALLKCVLRVQESHVQDTQQAQQARQQGGLSTQDSVQRGPTAGSDSTNLGAAAAAQQPATGGGASSKAPPAVPQQQQPQKQQQATAPGDQPAHSQPDLYAQAKLQANKDAAEGCERLARTAEQQGDWQRAVRLWQKACQLAPDNSQYQQAFSAASHKLAAAGEASGSSHSAGIHNVSPGAAGAPSGASSGGSTASRARSSGGSTAAPGAAAPPGSEAGARPSSGPPPAAQQQRERGEPGQQQQQGRTRQSAAGEQQQQQQHGEASTAGPQQEAQQAGRKSVGVGGTVSLLLGLAFMSAAAYCLYTTAPPRPGASSPTKAILADLAGGGPAATVAAAAAAVQRVTRREGVGGAAAASSGAGGVQSCHAPSLYPGADQRRDTHPTGGALRSTSLVGSTHGENEAAGEQGSTAASTAGGSSVVIGRKWLRIPGWLRRLGAALAYTVGEVFWAALFLPRVLLWQPSWQGVASFVMASVGVHLAVPNIYSLLRGESVDKTRLYMWTTHLGWQACMWLACGGGWLALLEVALFVAKPFRLWTASGPTLYLLLSPVMCYLASHLLRWAGRFLFTPALSLLWRPRWWSHLPPSLAALAYATSLPDGSLQERFAFYFSYLSATWYLSSGAWWGVACVLCVLSEPLLHSLWSSHWLVARLLGVLHLISFGPLVIVVARLVWVWTGSLAATALLATVVVGAAAVWLSEPAYAPGAGASQRSGGRSSGEGWFSYFGRGQKLHKHTSSAGAPSHLEHEVPQGAPEAVVKVLSSGNYFEVLGVSSDAGDTEIRRAKKTLSLATHPDKIGEQPGANEAFNLVIEAADTLSDPDRRRDYDAMLTQLDFEARLSSKRGPSGSFGAGLFGRGGAPAGVGDATADELLQQLGVPNACPNCGGEHTMFLVLRPPSAARLCEDCKGYHPVTEGEIWIERSKAGWFSYELKLYCCWRGLVWDISETGHCEELFRITHRRGFPFNSHFNPFKRPSAAYGGAGGGRQQAPRSERSRVNRKKSRRR